MCYEGAYKPAPFLPVSWKVNNYEGDKREIATSGRFAKLIFQRILSSVARFSRPAGRGGL